MNIFVNHTFVGNELWRFAALFVVLLIALVVGRIIRFIFERHGKKLMEKEQVEVIGLLFTFMAKPMVFISFSIGFYIAMHLLIIPAGIQTLVSVVNRVLISISTGYGIYNLVGVFDFYLARWASRTENKMDDMLVPMVRKSLRVTIVILVVLFIAENVSGKTIGTLIAGLGIGGLAVALAAQDTLKNFFASIMIMADQPFQIGDRVVIGDHDGPVEEVGFRSTKVRTLQGHVVTIPNSEVANTMVLNISKRPYIRRLTFITVTYDTPPEKMEEAVTILKTILEEHKENMHPDLPSRVYFKEFNSFSLDIMVIYWFAPPSYWDYQRVSNEINMKILQRFNDAGIDFAFPSQTVYHANDAKRQLAIKMLENGPLK